MESSVRKAIKKHIILLVDDYLYMYQSFYLENMAFRNTRMRESLKDKLIFNRGCLFKQVENGQKLTKMQNNAVHYY